MNSALIDERFGAGQLPDGWYTDTPRPKYDAGAWDCRGWDGVIIPLPHDAWNSLRVEIELSDIAPGATAFCGTDARTGLTLVLQGAPGFRHQATDGGLVLAQSATSIPLHPVPSRPFTLSFEWTSTLMRATANGVEALTAPNLRRSAAAGTLQLGFSKCLVRRLAVYGEARADIPAPPRALQPGYPLEVTVDFNDDLMACAWSHATFDALFRELKSWGASAVSWIDLGRPADGYFDFAPLAIDAHGQATLRNVGDVFAAAVSHAHRHGLELIGLLKPFDMAIHGWSWPPFSEKARQHGRISRIGGRYGWSTHLASDNQHLIMARKPSNQGPAVNRVWSRLDLVKDDALEPALALADIQLLVSDDNDTFRPYTGPVARLERVEDYPVYRATPSGPRPTAETRRSRVFRFENLAIREPFFAIRADGSARSFSNRLCDLVHLFGEHGEETRFTFGLAPRQAALGGGFEFNRYPGSPTNALASGGDAIVTPLALDRGEASFIALARGKDRGPLAALSPSFPETRALWLTWVTAMLDAGADGIDIRPGHHHADFTWIEYGFEPPVRDEMLTKTGVDIWETDDFDYDLWRRIRGEGWTQFLREAAEVVRGRGKKLTLHIDGYFEGAPGTGGGMNLASDWRTWLGEGLADRVTGKSLWPGSSLSREVLALAHAKGIPVSYAPYCNNFFEDRRTPNHIGDSPVGCEVPVDRLIDWGRRGGYDRFVFYECASALHARPDGTLGFRANAETLRKVMHRQFVESFSSSA